ncbi:MAG: [FeFe] hydrogenase, group A [Firmicutes bacterium]|nr:[FeFe] hydrogenase, group A [Bacillota bacterium]
MIQLTIDGRPIQVEPGTTVLEAARRLGIRIPTLCYLKEINQIGACRMCVVEVKGYRTLQTACSLPCADGMEVRTNTPAVRAARRMVLELLLSDHQVDCPTCLRAGDCELMRLAQETGLRSVRFTGEKHPARVDTSSPALAVDSSKCILCQRCVAVCREVQGVAAISLAGRGFASRVVPFFDHELGEAACTYCGQCTLVCPTGALTEKDDTEAVWAALLDPEKHVIVQTAPAIRVSLGEAFGLPPGTVATGQMVAALRRLGFDRVFDTNLGADLTIVEEASELIQRLRSGGPLPLMTSCCPGWVKYAEHFWPEFLDNLSSCKSPHQMFGAMAKTYYAQKMGIDPAKIVVVSIMPCTAKKFEASRPELAGSGYPDVDYVLTTRELARMLRQAGIDLAALPEEEFDAPLGISTGAGALFGATGGVMEAALRTASTWLEGEPRRLVFTEVRGLEGVREASLTIAGQELKVAVAHGLRNAARLLERIRSGEATYHFVEVMACPGGCVGGGGQPLPADGPDSLPALRQARVQAIYRVDEAKAIRYSHENPAIKQLYAEFLGEPLGEVPHRLLHTHYHARQPVGIRVR